MSGGPGERHRGAGAGGRPGAADRYAIVSLVVFSVAGFVLLALLPMRRAVLAAGNTPPERL